jgi:sugar phosphate isomerase/epimerase
MSDTPEIILAAKCAPNEKILSDIKKSGIEAVELYLQNEKLNNIDEIIKICKSFSFKYFVHSPNDGYNPQKLAEFVKKINAKIVVFHNIYWEDEWENIVKTFKDVKTKLCVENISTVHEPLKLMRRYGFGRCLDLEHLQMECAGVFEEMFIPIIKDSSHIHLTGYVFGSDLWHTHIHYSPEHNKYMLDLIKKSGFSGFVVSEAKNSLQTYEEFKKLYEFYNMWKLKKYEKSVSSY